MAKAYLLIISLSGHSEIAVYVGPERYFLLLAVDVQQGKEILYSVKFREDMVENSVYHVRARLYSFLAVDRGGLASVRVGVSTDSAEGESIRRPFLRLLYEVASCALGVPLR